ncbi:hypothetical protein BDM02DRAFT_1465740 [Thelephora ganbajun]|uniref:Uncharacterized protein n=1 Tax=Thelephora ganbajun TaxID=370292 RepID=A0ACB6ZLS0_THEGA|nr:hypothetical protein BDM02DRAFT_1465740 [Thelephora ganbajun]
MVDRSSFSCLFSLPRIPRSLPFLLSYPRDSRVVLSTTGSVTTKAKSPPSRTPRQTAQMDSQASFLPAGYPTYSNAGGWEGTWPQESYPHTNTQGPYQYSPTQGSVRCRSPVSVKTMNNSHCQLQPLHEGTVPTSDHSSTFNQNTTQGYSHSFDAHNITVHPMYPIQGGLAANVYDNTVLGAYDPSLPQSFSNDPEFPLLSQEDLRVVVPQPPYECGNNQREWDQKPSILFSTGGHPGVRLFDAANGTFSGIDDRDGFPFNANCRGVTIRIHVGS